MGRKSITGETLVVDIDGTLLAWTDGHLSTSNNDFRSKAVLASRVKAEANITPYGPLVAADLTDPTNPLGALASMLLASPGRGRIIQAPRSLTDALPLEKDDPSVTSTSALIEILNGGN